MPNKFEVDVAVRCLHHTRDCNELHCLHTGEEELGPCLVATTLAIWRFPRTVCAALDLLTWMQQDTEYFYTSSKLNTLCTDRPTLLLTLYL